MSIKGSIAFSRKKIYYVTAAYKLHLYFNLSMQLVIKVTLLH